MRKNSVKQALAAGQVQLGCAFAQLRSQEVARILAAAGFDWAFVDMEHGGFDYETVQDICRISSYVGFTPIVRVPDMQYPLVARALDCGSGGIIFPRVESAELLEKAISWTKFPPEGVRGFGLSTMQVDYEQATIPEILNHMNENLLVVLQIETALAVEIREELLAVPGIDAVLIGPVDLSISLGCPGDFMNPKMVDAMEAVRDTCNRRGIAPGTQTRNLTLSKFWRDRGMRFLGCSSETGMLLERATELVNALR
jgi:2-keto-3-deoxy-L-rhamnonate aldolase RhmA